MPLQYQITKYDCVPTTIINGIQVLLRRGEILPEVIKVIYLYSLDTRDKNGKIGGRGTSYNAIELICNSLNELLDFNITMEIFRGKDVSLKRISDCIKKGGVACVRIYYKSNLYHYILVVNLDDDNIYAFDPYFRKIKYEDSEVELINSLFCNYNRIISKERFNSKYEQLFAMSSDNERECIIMNLC